LDKTDGRFDAATFAQQFNHFSPEYGPHFKEIYRHMRAHCPVAHTDEVGGFWVVTQYADIMRAARDYEAFSSRYGVTITPSVNPGTPRQGFGLLGGERTGPLAAYPPGPNGEAPRLNFLPLELDPPLHGLYRKALDPLFSPHALAPGPAPRALLGPSAPRGASSGGGSPAWSIVSPPGWTTSEPG